MSSRKYSKTRPIRGVLLLKKQGIGIFLLMLGIVSLLYGVHRQEHQTVKQKSTLICLECIGIG